MPVCLQAELKFRAAWLPASQQPNNCLKARLVSMLLGISIVTVHSCAMASESTGSLDQEVQSVKTRAVELLGTLKHLELQLLYPAYTRVTVFVSLNQDTPLLPESVELDIDGSNAARYIYSDREIQALRAGGIQRLYIGNINNGEHTLSFTLNTIENDGRRQKHQTAYAFNKSVKEKLIEIKLGDSGLQQQPLLVRSTN